MEETLIKWPTARLAKSKGFQGINPTTDFVPMYVGIDDYDKCRAAIDPHLRGQELADARRKCNEIDTIFDSILDYEDAKLTEGQGEDDARSHYVLAATQTILQKWIRETHFIDVEARGVRIEGKTKTEYYRSFINGILVSILTQFDTYEEALEIALFSALETLPTTL